MRSSTYFSSLGSGWAASGVGGAFDGFVGIGVARRGGATERAFHEAAGLGEVVELAGGFGLLEDVPERDGATGFEAGGPELIRDMNGGERRGVDGIILVHLGLRERKEKANTTRQLATGRFGCTCETPYR